MTLCDPIIANNQERSPLDLPEGVPPLNSYYVYMTAGCNLACQHCWLTPTFQSNGGTGGHLDFDLFALAIDEGLPLGLRNIKLTGGEPLLHPELFNAIKLIRLCGMRSFMATSGMGLTAEVIDRLVESGLGALYLSLNGSTKEIHEVSRGNYDATIKALSLLKEGDLWYGINWVARNDNVDDFSDLVDLCVGHYKAKAIDVLMLKPDVNNKIDCCLDEYQAIFLANQIKKLQNLGCCINVEFCFTQLRHYLPLDDEDVVVGCPAGIFLMAINVEGEKMPCRHLIHLADETKDIISYWEGSDAFKRFRSANRNIKEPCNNCSYFKLKKCGPCRAVADKIHGVSESKEADCPLL